MTTYKVLQSHTVRSIVSGIYHIETGSIVEGVEVGNGYVMINKLDMELYIPREKLQHINSNAQPI